MDFQKEQSGLAVFSKRGEWINLILPAFFVPMFLMNFFIRYPSPSVTLWARWIVGAIFFNTIHVTFTAVNLVQIPEMRAFAERRSAFGLYGQYAKWTAIFVGLYLFAKVCLDQTFHGWTSNRWLLTPMLMGLVRDVFSIPHFLHQSKGISLMYSYQIRKNSNLTSVELQQLSKSERTEKRIFTILSLSCVSATVVNWIAYSWDFRAVSWFFLAVNSACVLMLFRNLKLLPQASRGYKRNYLVRMIYWPLSLCNFFWGDMVTRSIHGVEYVMINDNIVGNTKCRKPLLLWTTLILGGVSMMAAQIFCEGILEDRRILTELGALLFATSLFHYYVDAILFQFRDPSVRELIGPLVQPLEIAPECIPEPA